MRKEKSVAVLEHQLVEVEVRGLRVAEHVGPVGPG